MAATHKSKIKSASAQHRPLPPLARLTTAKTAYVQFKSAPFPYRGRIPDSGKPFLDVTENDRHGHTSRDGVHWEDQIYHDSRVLLYIPNGFDVRRPALMVVFFHGNGALLERDVVERQQVVAQLQRSGINAVLVVPQFAMDALDSSAGRMWQRRAFAEFITEAGVQLSTLYGDSRAKVALTKLPIVLVAYSGGYLPAAWSLARGGIESRIRGVVLFDALYGQLDKFSDWFLRARKSAFCMSAFTESTQDGNEAMMEDLHDAGLRVQTSLPTSLTPGSVAFIRSAPNIKHEDFVTLAWTENPLTAVLSKIPGYSQVPLAPKKSPTKKQHKLSSKSAKTKK